MADKASGELKSLSAALSDVVGMSLVLMTTERLQAIRAALEPFAAFVDGQPLPDDLPITQGSRMARRQLTVGDCRRAGEVVALLQKETLLVVEANRG